MAKTKPLPPLSLPDDANSLSITFYVADAAAVPPNHPRIIVHFPNGPNFDRPVSDYTSLTPAQKTNLRTMLLALRDETFTLEGYT